MSTADLIRRLARLTPPPPTCRVCRGGPPFAATLQVRSAKALAAIRDGRGPVNCPECGGPLGPIFATCEQLPLAEWCRLATTWSRRITANPPATNGEPHANGN